MSILNPIVKKNLKLMRSNRGGGMVKSIMTESLGGNAGAFHQGINFYYNKETGEIVYFGNIQDVPSKFINDQLYVEGSFSYYNKFGVSKGMVFGDSKIDRIIYNKKDTKTARINLALTAEIYNELYGGYKERKLAA